MSLKYEPQDTFASRSEIDERLLAYKSTPDADFVQIKAKIKKALIQCPQLLYALHNTELEDELFDEDGNLLTEGEWDAYLTKNIRPYLFYPEVIDHIMHYISFKVEFEDFPNYNNAMKYCEVTFVIMCDGTDVDMANGISRHDLIAAILIDRFNGSNIFGTRAVLTSSQEGYYDNRFLTRTLVFRLTNPSGKFKTQNGVTRLVGNSEVYN